MATNTIHVSSAQNESDSPFESEYDYEEDNNTNNYNNDDRNYPEQGKGIFLEEPIENYSFLTTYTRTSDKKEYKLPRNKEYLAWINTEYNKYKYKPGNNKTKDQYGHDLYNYQHFIIEYMKYDNPYRSILLYHDPGSGKTLPAVKIAESYREKNIKTYILLPASLKDTWRKQLKTWGNKDIRYPENYNNLNETEKKKWDDESDNIINKNYIFISSNAANTLANMKSYTNGQFKHSLIIVDESHNLISRIVNNISKNRNNTHGEGIYKMLMDAYDCKIIFLSATPMINIPFELAITFNILKGYMFTYTNGKKEKLKLFNDDIDLFNNIYIDSTGNNYEIKNRHKFSKLIIGLVSNIKLNSNEDVAKIVSDENILCNFSDNQYTKYIETRRIELSKIKHSKKVTNEIVDVLDQQDYRTKSRQICNVVFDEFNTKERFNNASIDKLINASPKIHKMITNILDTGNTCSYIYSNFVNNHGILFIKKMLEHYKFEELNIKNITSDSKKNRYVIYTGKISNEDKFKIKDIFNSEQNKNGAICKIFIGSPASSEGISLFNIRQVYILEPHWNSIRLEQVIGRARRVGSHKNLAIEDRKIKVYKYLMTFSETQKKESPISEIFSTDEHINNISKIKNELNKKFLSIIKNTSLDCNLNIDNNYSEDDPIKCLQYGINEKGDVFNEIDLNPSIFDQDNSDYNPKNYSFNTYNYVEFSEEFISNILLIKNAVEDLNTDEKIIAFLNNDDKKDYKYTKVKVDTNKQSEIIVNGILLYTFSESKEGIFSPIEKGVIIPPSKYTDNKYIFLKKYKVCENQ